MDDRTATERFEQALHEPGQRYFLRLYVAGTAPSSAQAVARVRALCDRYLDGQYDLEVVDIHQQPARARDDDIFAVPTLLKQLPAPIQRIIGDLSDEDRVLVRLGVELKP